MEWTSVTLIAAVLLVCFLVSGMPVAVGFMGAGLILLCWLMGGTKAFVLAATSAASSITNFTLVPIPLFILMGEALSTTGLITIIVDAVDQWIGHLRARLAIVGIVAGTILAAMTGVGMGSLAVLGTTLLPEMLKRGYDKRLCFGSLMAAALIAPIIPPSLLGVLVATLGGLSVGGLLISGTIPGLILAAAFITYCVVLTRINPKLAPIYPSETVPLRTKVKSLLKLVPFGLIIFAVLGVISLGIATPSEASALGVLACYAVAALYRRLTFKAIKDSLFATIRVSGMVMFILIGATLFTQVLGTTGVIRGVANWVAALPVSPIGMVILFQLIVFTLCMFIDQIAMMMITLPIFMPVVNVGGFSPLAFGTVYLLNVTAGGLTPPFGYLLFVMKGIYPEASMREIWEAAVPFILIVLVTMVLIIAFPILATWFPDVVMKAAG